MRVDLEVGVQVLGEEELGLEVALDVVLHCAPDHPWVSSNPEWFTIRNDGSIAFAESRPRSTRTSTR